MIQGSNPITGKIFLVSKCPDQLWGPPSQLFNGCQVSFTGEVDYPTPSTGKMKNKCSCTLTPYICLQGVERQNLTCFYFFTSMFLVVDFV